MSNPAEKENSRRSVPPSILSPVRENPTQRSPYGPQMAKAESPSPARITSTLRAFVGSLRINNAYRILPMYSKKSDQLGPLSGNISPTPLISVPGVAGISKALITVATNSIATEIFETSQAGQPWK